MREFAFIPGDKVRLTTGETGEVKSTSDWEDRLEVLTDGGERLLVPYNELRPKFENPLSRSAKACRYIRRRFGRVA